MLPNSKLNYQQQNNPRQHFDISNEATISYPTPNEQDFKCSECDFVAFSFPIYKRHISLHLQFMREKLVENNLSIRNSNYRNFDNRPLHDEMRGQTLHENRPLYDEMRGQPHYENRPLYDEMRGQPNYENRPLYDEMRGQPQYENMPVYDKMSAQPQYENGPLYDEMRGQSQYENMPVYDKMSAQPQYENRPLHDEMRGQSQYENRPLHDEMRRQPQYETSMFDNYIPPFEKSPIWTFPNGPFSQIVDSQNTISNKIRWKSSDTMPNQFKKAKRPNKNTSSLPNTKKAEVAKTNPDISNKISKNTSFLSNRDVCITKVEGFFCLACKEYLFKDSSQASEEQKLSHAQTKQHLENLKKYKDHNGSNE